MHVKLALTKDVEPEVDRRVLDVQVLSSLKGALASDDERADDFGTDGVGLFQQGSEGVHVEVDGHGVRNQELPLDLSLSVT